MPNMRNGSKVSRNFFSFLFVCVRTCVNVHTRAFAIRLEDFCFDFMNNIDDVWIPGLAGTVYSLKG